MDHDPTARLLWRIRASAVLGRVADAERRFAASLSVNEVTILAAADELAAATRDASAWLAANACPDAGFRRHVDLMLNTCAEVASTAQRTINDPTADSEAIIRRFGDLLEIIDFHSQTLDAW
jgi:hypothetical protein